MMRSSQIFSLKKMADLQRLSPLSWEACAKNSPAFRESLRDHEAAVEVLELNLKRLHKDGKAMLMTGQGFCFFCQSLLFR